MIWLYCRSNYFLQIRQHRYYLALVAAHIHDAAALGAHDDDGDIDNRHERHAENTRLYRVCGDLLRLRNPQIADHVDHDDAERKRSERVHRVVSFHKTGEEAA